MLIFQKLMFFCFCFKTVTSTFNLQVQITYSSPTAEALIFLLCKIDYQTIIINDDSKETGSRFMQQLHERFHSVILYKKDRQHQNVFSYVKKVDAILIIVSSSKNLSEILEKLCTTVWWNVMTPIYVLNLPDNDCKIATKILKEMWSYNILTSYYLCKKKKIIQIYTYNPFTNQAPSQWIKTQKSLLKSNWTLYQRKYTSSAEIICKGLVFDRTKNLDGHQITVATTSSNEEGHSLAGEFIEYTNLHHYSNIISDRHRLILDTFAKTLNVTLRLYIIKVKGNDGKTLRLDPPFLESVHINTSANLILIHKSLEEMNMSNLQNDLLTKTYPLAWSEYVIASYNRGYRTIAEKLWNFYGIWTSLFTVIILSITFAVIWLTESRRTSFATFEIIRLLINHSLYTRMNTLPLRIFFITILIYFLIVQATFHGNLAKFLTKQEFRKHPETKEDLMELNDRKVYTSKDVKTYLLKTKEEKTHHIVSAKLCLKHMLRNDSSIVCVFDRRSLLKHSQQNLYISKKPIWPKYVGYIIANHWPLSKRVNSLFLLLDVFGFRKLKSDEKGKNKFKHYSTVAEARAHEDFHPLKLENLMFSFGILAIGLICATLSFCVEIFKSYKLKRHLICYVQNK